MDENTIVVTDELGNEVEYEILFTFENEENGHQYVVYFDPEKDEPEAQAAIFDDEGSSRPVYPVIADKPGNTDCNKSNSCSCDKDHASCSFPFVIFNFLLKCFR